MEALQSNFTGPWLLTALATNPRLMGKGLGLVVRRLVGIS